MQLILSYFNVLEALMTVKWLIMTFFAHKSKRLHRFSGDRHSVTRQSSCRVWTHGPFFLVFYKVLGGKNRSARDPSTPSVQIENAVVIVSPSLYCIHQAH